MTTAFHLTSVNKPTEINVSNVPTCRILQTVDVDDALHLTNLLLGKLSLAPIQSDFVDDMPLVRVPLLRAADILQDNYKRSNLYKRKYGPDIIFLPSCGSGKIGDIPIYPRLVKDISRVERPRK